MTQTTNRHRCHRRLEGHKVKGGIGVITRVARVIVLSVGTSIRWLHLAQVELILYRYIRLTLWATHSLMHPR